MPPFIIIAYLFSDLLAYTPASAGCSTMAGVSVVSTATTGAEVVPAGVPDLDLQRIQQNITEYNSTHKHGLV